MGTVLTVDLGGSKLKASLFGTDGETIASASRSLLFDEDAQGKSEQDPSFWWNSLVEICDEIFSQTAGPFESISAIAVCGFTRTQVFLNSKGQAVRPAICFRDSRAQAIVDEIFAGLDGKDAPSTNDLNGFHPLARLLWVRRYEPENWEATKLVLEPKDYLNLQLTGVAKSDSVSQWRMQEGLRDWKSLVAELAEVSKGRLPQISKPSDVVGPVMPNLPGALARIAGAAVFSSSMDSWASSVGLGAVRPGTAYCISGSSEVFGFVADRPASAPGLLQAAWGDGVWLIGGPGQNGANTLDWILDVLDPSSGAFEERLSQVMSGASSSSPLLFLPFLNGERMPFWDSALRAAFLGLNAGHQRKDLALAVMQGVAFLNREVLERAEAATGQKAPEIRIGGGGSRSDPWNQIRADSIGRPILVPTSHDSGLLGCLALARFGLGLEPSLDEAAQKVSSSFKRFTPNSDAARSADVLFKLFQSSQATLAPISHHLARLGRENSAARK